MSGAASPAWTRRGFIAATGSAAALAAVPAIASRRGFANTDIRLLGELIETLHPGLLRYATRPAIARGLERLDSGWAAQGLAQRFLALSRFLATLRCGHTYPSLFNQKRPVAAELFARKDRLPFAFRWIDGNMVVLADHSGTGLFSAGSTILSIDGIAPRRILAALIPYARADGGNDGKRRALLGVGGDDSIEAFDVYFARHFARVPDQPVAVEWRDPAGRRRRESFSPLDLPGRRAFRRTVDERSNAALWQFAIDDDGIARLTMDSWAVYNSKWDWKGWLAARLDELSDAKALVLDLRRNEGGNDCGDAILARLAGRDIPLPAETRRVRYRKVPDHLNAHLDTWDDSFRNWGTSAVPDSEGFFRLEEGDRPRVVPADSRHLVRPLVILTSPQNSSATFRFSNLARTSGLARLVGEPTGGNRRGINGGRFFFARLPDSGLEFDLPLIGYFPATREPDAGLLPDVFVRADAADIAAARDPAMARARALLLGKA